MSHPVWGDIFDRPEKKFGFHSRPTRTVYIPFPTDFVESVKLEMECLVIIHDWPTFSQVHTLVLFFIPFNIFLKKFEKKSSVRACCETSASSPIGIKLPSHPFHWESLWGGAADSHGPAPDSNPGWHFAEHPAGRVYPSTAAFTTGQYKLQHVIVLSQNLPSGQMCAYILKWFALQK